MRSSSIWSCYLILVLSSHTLRWSAPTRVTLTTNREEVEQVRTFNNVGIYVRRPNVGSQHHVLVKKPPLVCLQVHKDSSPKEASDQWPCLTPGQIHSPCFRSGAEKISSDYTPPPPDIVFFETEKKGKSHLGKCGSLEEGRAEKESFVKFHKEANFGRKISLGASLQMKAIRR